MNIGNQITLPDGSLLTAFCLCLGDRYVGDAMRAGTNIGQYTNSAFRSTDGGSNWVFRAVVADPRNYLHSVMGPSGEVDLTMLADNETILAVMRNDGDCNCGASATSRAGKPSDCGIYVSYDQSYSTYVAAVSLPLPTWCMRFSHTATL